HEGLIDWPTVAQQGCQFVFIKATEGGDFKDPRYLENWQNARAAGFTVGAYHSDTFCRPVEDQAANLIATVPADPTSFPPTLDLEFGGNCSKQPSRDELLKDLEFITTKLQTTYGAKPILYVTNEFFEVYLADAP